MRKGGIQLLIQGDEESRTNLEKFFYRHPFDLAITWKKGVFSRIYMEGGAKCGNPIIRLPVWPL